jgi:HJR/Mrr/RecB family endonuclease
MNLESMKSRKSFVPQNFVVMDEGKMKLSQKERNWKGSCLGSFEFTVHSSERVDVVVMMVFLSDNQRHETLDARQEMIYALLFQRPFFSHPSLILSTLGSKQRQETRSFCALLSRQEGDTQETTQEMTWTSKGGTRKTDRHSIERQTRQDFQELTEQNFANE